MANISRLVNFRPSFTISANACAHQLAHAQDASVPTLDVADVEEQFGNFYDNTSTLSESREIAPRPQEGCANRVTSL
jgi:hypothetical protein